MELESDVGPNISDGLSNERETTLMSTNQFDNTDGTINSTPSDSNESTGANNPGSAALPAIDLVPLAGSEKTSADVISGTDPVGPDAVDAGVRASALGEASQIEATVVVRRRDAVEVGEIPPRLSQQEFAQRFGADPADIELVDSTLTGFGLVVLSSDYVSRRVRVRGSLQTMVTVFGASLTHVTSRAHDGSEVQHRNRSGMLMIPAVLDGVVVAVLGLDDRPQARAEFRVAEAHAVTTSYTPLDLAKIYGFPAAFDGAGQTIAIIELGGGFAQSELDTYFSSLGITGPRVTAVGVDGAQNQPGLDPNGADGEVLLDIEVAGALSPGADIVVYFAPNTDAGFVDAVSEATHAAVTPTSMSISWGQSEDTWTAQARTALDNAFVDAAALGITVTVAAGDNGSSDGAADGRNHADFPASSPHVLSCGGTSLQAAGGRVTTEVVWNSGSGGGATGGGVSDVFALPSWQVKARVPKPSSKAGGRGVPDVSAVADPATGYQVLVDGQRKVYGGTSAVAPLWAALIARLAQSTGSPFGLINPLLYEVHTAPPVAAPAPASNATARPTAPTTVQGFRDIIRGNNGSYAAAPGWDACTGLGVPDGAQLLKLVTAGPAVASD